MATSNRSIVAGVFADELHAQQAMADLQDAGFREDQIRYSPHKSGADIQVTDTVRHEEARIERTGDVTVERDDTGMQGQ